MKKKNDPFPSKKRGGLSGWFNQYRCQLNLVLYRPIKVSVVDDSTFTSYRDEKLKELRKKFPVELVNLIFNLGGDFTTADNVLAIVEQSHGGMYLCECDNPECLLEQHLDDEQYIRLSFSNYPKVHISRVLHPDCGNWTNDPDWYSDGQYVTAPRSQL